MQFKLIYKPPLLGEISVENFKKFSEKLILDKNKTYTCKNQGEDLIFTANNVPDNMESMGIFWESIDKQYGCKEGEELT